MCISSKIKKLFEVLKVSSQCEQSIMLIFVASKVLSIINFIKEQNKKLITLWMS